MSDRHGNCSISSWQRALAIAAARRAAGADDEPSSRPNGSATACAGRNTRGVAARYPSEDGSDARETHRAAARVVLMHCMYARRRAAYVRQFVDVVRVTEKFDSFEFQLSLCAVEPGVEAVWAGPWRRRRATGWGMRRRGCGRAARGRWRGGQARESGARTGRQHARGARGAGAAAVRA